MDINKLLDECSEKLNAKNDYQLSLKSGMSDARISDYRNGRRLPKSKDCFIIADILNLDSRKLIAHFEALGAKSPKTKEFWEKKLAELGGIAASIFFAVTFFMSPTPSQAAPALKTTVLVCILC